MQKENIVIKNYILSSKVFFLDKKENSFDNNFPTEICQYYELVTQNKVSV